jgi:exonuclease VII small subunit
MFAWLHAWIDRHEDPHQALQASLAVQADRIRQTQRRYLHAVHTRSTAEATWRRAQRHVQRLEALSPRLPDAAATLARARADAQHAERHWQAAQQACTHWHTQLVQQQRQRAHLQAVAPAIEAGWSAERRHLTKPASPRDSAT